MAKPSYSDQELERALSELRDIYIPLPEGGWALGHNTLVTIGLVLLTALSMGLIRRYFSKSPRHLALKELESIRHAHRHGASPRATISAAATVVRRLALALYPTPDVAGLTGQAWLEFLAQVAGQVSERCSFFFDGDGVVLGAGPFSRSTPSFDAEALLSGLEHWVRNATTAHLSWSDKFMDPPQGLPPLYP